MYPERRLAPFEPGPEGRAFGRDNTEITGAGGDELEGDDLRCRAASGLREVQGSAGLVVRLQTLEQEQTNSRNASRVCVDESRQRQYTNLPCDHGGCGMRAACERESVARRMQLGGTRSAGTHGRATAGTHTAEIFRLRRSTAAQQIHGSCESYECLHAMGWMGEGGELPSSP